MHSLYSTHNCTCLLTSQACRIDYPNITLLPSLGLSMVSWQEQRDGLPISYMHVKSQIVLASQSNATVMQLQTALGTVLKDTTCSRCIASTKSGSRS